MQPQLGMAAFVVAAACSPASSSSGRSSAASSTPRATSPSSTRDRRRDVGIAALSDGFIALQAGDPSRARVLAREARSNLPRNHAAQLLEARSDLALGDMQSAREHYRALISNKKTAVAALAGLYEQARTQGRTDAALELRAEGRGARAADRAGPPTRVLDDLDAPRPVGAGARPRQRRGRR